MKLFDVEMEPADGNYFIGGHDIHDVKLGQAIRRVERQDDLHNADIVLIGFPTDEGVKLNKGRPGAAQAPAAIRSALYKLNAYDAERDIALSPIHIVDAGDIAMKGDLAWAQDRLGKLVSHIIASQAIPIVLGGGHETSYGHFLGHVLNGSSTAIVNLDAHLDVRELRDGKPHSGSPFRQALEHRSGLLGNRYTVVAAQPHANSKTYTKWLLERGGTVRWFSEVEREGIDPVFAQALDLKASHSLMVTFDMDVVSSAFAPGTSAASPLGIDASDFVTAARLAGTHRAVRSFDIVEVSPPHDRDGQTARLAAIAIHAFIVGFARRGKA